MDSVISRTLRLTASLCCLLVVASFALFARDQVAGASERQQTALVAGASPSTASNAPNKPGAQPRRYIDGVAKTLTAPFDAIVRSANPWVKHGLPALLPCSSTGSVWGIWRGIPPPRPESLRALNDA